MKKIFILTLLALSFSVWGQSGLRLIDPDAKPERVIAQMMFCLPLVEANDSLVTLTCAGVRIEMPMEKINGELTIVIKPSAEDGPLEFKETIEWYLAPKSYYRDSLNINIY